MVDRRTIIFQNYLILENRLHGQFQPIAQNWRHAVEEFPDDLAILEKYRSVIWAWWLSEIDQALLKAARGEDQKANLKHLFEQNAAFYPDLFRPIQTLAGYEVKTGLDAFHKEIKLRQTSLSVMEQADLNLSIKADNLALVLNDLRAAKNKLKRTELDEKIKSLAAGFTEDEVKLASDYIMHDQRIEAVEHYLRAYSLGAWEEGETWLTVPRTKGDVTAYWEKLRTDIDGFQEKSGDIYQQRTIARQYAIRIEELRACNQTWAQKKINWIPLSQIDSTNSKLIEKLKLLEWGIDNINHFMPLDDLWKAAVNPAILSKIAANPAESFSSITSSWGQLERYLRGLKSQLGVTHTQVVSLSNWLDRFQKAVVALYQGVGTLRDDLLSTEDYKACLEVCRKINDNTLRLIEWEPQYFDLWESWRGKDLRQKFTNFYPNQATVYEAVKYKHGELTLRYFIEGEAFYTWQKDLNTYILVASTNVSPLPQQDVLNEVVYTFDEIRFNLYNGLHPDLYQTLRVELEQGGIFLGRFLVLAYIDKVLWDKEIDAFDQKVEASRALERIVGNNNPNKLTAMRTEIFYLAMQSWIVSLENRLNGSMPIAESSQSERVRIAQAVQIGNSLVPEGELQTRLKLMQQRVDYICRTEDNALNRFYADLNDVNRTSLTGDSLENVTTLKRFYEYSPLNQPTQDLYKKMGIASEKLMAIDTDYNNNYKRLHEFLVYCEEVVQDIKL